VFPFGLIFSLPLATERCDEEGRIFLGSMMCRSIPFSRHIGLATAPDIVLSFYPHHLRVLGLFDLILKNNLGSASGPMRAISAVGKATVSLSRPICLQTYGHSPSIDLRTMIEIRGLWLAIGVQHLRPCRMIPWCSWSTPGR